MMLEPPARFQHEAPMLAWSAGVIADFADVQKLKDVQVDDGTKLQAGLL